MIQSGIHCILLLYYFSGYTQKRKTPVDTARSINRESATILKENSLNSECNRRVLSLLQKFLHDLPRKLGVLRLNFLFVKRTENDYLEYLVK